MCVFCIGILGCTVLDVRAKMANTEWYKKANKGAMLLRLRQHRLVGYMKNLLRTKAVTRSCAIWRR